MKKTVLILVIIIAVMVVFIAGVFLPFAAATKGKPIAAYATPKTALVIIDIQKDITEKNGKRPLNLMQTDSMIPAVNDLIQNVAKKGWLIVYITHEYRRASLLRLVTQDFLLEGMPGAAMDSRLLIINQNHFVKYRMDAFSNSEFDAFLRKNQVNKLLITGMAAEECIDRTCQGALNRKYAVTIISDAIAGRSDDSRTNKIRDFEKYGASIVDAKTIIRENLQ